MVSRQSVQFMRIPGRAGEPESFTAVPFGVLLSTRFVTQGCANVRCSSHSLRPGLT